MPEVQQTYGVTPRVSPLGCAAAWFEEDGVFDRRPVSTGARVVDPDPPPLLKWRPTVLRSTSCGASGLVLSTCPAPEDTQPVASVRARIRASRQAKVFQGRGQHCIGDRVQMVAQGKVIILNGGSSAGKTSLGKELQRQLLEPYLLMGIDLFWFTMPEKQLNLETVDPQYYSCVEESDDGQPYFRIVPGPILDQMMLAKYRAIAAYLDQGLNVIADEVFWKREWLEEGLRVFQPYEAWYVGVYCDDRTLNHREIMRGDRTAGWGRGSQLYTHRDASYDIVIDTSISGPPEHARKIAAAVTSGERPTASQKMRVALGLA